MAIDKTAEYAVENDEFANLDTPITDRPAQSTSTAIQTGWGAASTNTSSSGMEFPKEFKFVDGEFQIVKFLDEEGPFAVYKQHFLTQVTTGRRSYVSTGPNDPLITKLGSKPEEKRAFSIANLSAAGGPQRQMLIASPRLFKSLHAAHFSPQGPLTKNYWAISRSGKMAATVYHLNAIKTRDLAEDWGITDINAIEAAVAAMKPFTRADIKEHTVEELEAVANSLL
jgi:hypothetical protein